MQNENITCESPIEDGCYNKACRTLKLADICVHCGALRAPDFLFGLKELREKCLTGGYLCLPIYKHCLGSRQKIIQKGRKNATQERKEKESPSGN